MTSVLIALADVGLAVQLEEQLNRAGQTPGQVDAATAEPWLRATWDAAQVDGPRSNASADVVIVDADRLGSQLATAAAAWREQPGIPGVVAIGSSPAARDQAPRARVTLIAATARLSTVLVAIREAAALRLAAGLRWPWLRAALDLPAADNARPAWHATLTAARAIDVTIPRAALRWYVQCYATPTARFDELRAERVLTVPELEASAHIDGSRTVQRLVKHGPLDAMAMARLLWALGSMDALELTAEVTDLATPARRALAEIRAHLRARVDRLERSTFYDVLELTPLAEIEDIEAAYLRVAQRFGPDVLATYDLGDLAGLVDSTWELVEKARSVLVDHAQRGRYHDWLRQKLPELRTVWAIDPSAVAAAAAAFTRGQRALGEGDAHRAMSDLAAACRHFPGHPEYEASLAWARYRVQVASGKDRVDAALVERTMLDELLLGRRPWPRALVALALLCSAAGDLDAARWHVRVALAIDPNESAAIQLAQRLGMRRDGRPTL